jgi:hypothetical protein
MMPSAASLPTWAVQPVLALPARTAVMMMDPATPLPWLEVACMRGIRMLKSWRMRKRRSMDVSEKDLFSISRKNGRPASFALHVCLLLDT